jgi:hypothetical protein
LILKFWHFTWFVITGDVVFVGASLARVQCLRLRALRSTWRGSFDSSIFCFLFVSFTVFGVGRVLIGYVTQLLSKLLKENETKAIIKLGNKHAQPVITVPHYHDLPLT